MFLLPMAKWQKWQITVSVRRMGTLFSDKLVVGDLDCITHAVYDLHHEALVKCDDMLLAVLIVVGA